MFDSKKNSLEENSKTSNTQAGVPCLHAGRRKWFQAYGMHPHSLTIWDDIPYVDAFGDAWKQFNGELAVHMGLLCVVRTSSSYSQLGRVVQFLQNFLTQSIVKSMSLPVGVAKVVIDILFCGVEQWCASPLSAVYSRTCHC